MHSTIFRGLAAASLAAATACASSSITTRSDFDQRVDFTKYQTFAIAEESGELNILATDGYDVAVMGGQLAPDLLAMAAETIEDILVSKGLTAVADIESADLIVTYFVNVGAKPEVLAPDYRVDTWSGESELGQDPVARGTLVVDILDPSLGETDRSFLVWRGWASKTLDPDDPPENRGENLERGLRRVLGRYPK
jgi:hypothetical protein